MAGITKTDFFIRLISQRHKAGQEEDVKCKETRVRESGEQNRITMNEGINKSMIFLRLKFDGRKNCLLLRDHYKEAQISRPNFGNIMSGRKMRKIIFLWLKSDEEE